MAEVLYGKPVADALCEELAGRIATLKAQGTNPTLAILRVGAREDDLAYERGASKRFDGLGIQIRKFELPLDCSQEQLLEAIEEINKNPEIHGCLMFRPLPEHLDEEEACRAIRPAKDMDGITQGSMFGMFANQPVGYPPCTAEACIRILEHYGVELAGAKTCVIGRSLVVGKPVSMMLQARDATVTMCHTRTRDLKAIAQGAEVLVVAAGSIGLIGPDSVSPGQTIIDVGINWDDENDKLSGDVRFDEVEPIVAALTPVPGGVGAVTTAVLASHVVDAAERL